MSPLVIQQEQEAVRIPPWVRDLASFRRWAKSDDFPERGWYAHLNGELWVDPSMETLVHNKLKHKIGSVLGSLVEQEDLGEYLADRMLLTNMQAGLSTEPDGMFLGNEAVRQGRVQLERGDESLEVEGSPDMVLEVISRSSVQKDTVVLPDLYWQAGVREYWLTDPRRDGILFDIFRAGPKGFVASRKQGGWIRSPVFDKSFRLTRHKNSLGNAAFTLEMR